MPLSFLTTQGILPPARPPIHTQTHTHTFFLKLLCLELLCMVVSVDSRKVGTWSPPEVSVKTGPSTVGPSPAL